MSEGMFQGRVIDDLTEIVERAEHRALELVPRSKAAAASAAMVVPSKVEEDDYLLGAA